MNAFIESQPIRNMLSPFTRNKKQPTLLKTSIRLFKSCKLGSKRLMIVFSQGGETSEKTETVNRFTTFIFDMWLKHFNK